MNTEEFAEFVKEMGGVARAARLMGISQPQVSQLKNGGRSIGYAIEARVKQARELNRRGDAPHISNAALPPSNAVILSDSEVIMIPLYDRRVNAGRGVDTDGVSEFRMLLTRGSVPHPERSFAVKASGDSMISAGITDDSVLICERVDGGDIESFVGKMVIAGVDGAVYVKRLIKHRGKYYLRSEHPETGKYEDIDLSPHISFQIIATVVQVKHYMTT